MSLLLPIDQRDQKPYVNSNRVYVAGFSAGGDGVYRLSTIISDRFAGANMSGGHPGNTDGDPNRIKLENLANLPLCLQVGEIDSTVKGTKASKAEEVSSMLSGLQKTIPGPYVHECYIHQGGEHDETPSDPNHPWSMAEYGTDTNPVFTQFLQMRPAGATGTAFSMNTNAVTRMNNMGKARNPIPIRVVWNLMSRTPHPVLNAPAVWSEKRFFYWLYLMNPASTSLLNDSKKGDVIVGASYDKGSNTITIDAPNDCIGLLVNSDMLTLSKPINVQLGKSSTTKKQITVTPSDQMKLATTNARGDPAFAFSAMIYFKFANNVWDVACTNTLV